MEVGEKGGADNFQDCGDEPLMSLNASSGQGAEIKAY